MNNELERIPIFFAVDDSYTHFLAVALQSLIDNSSQEYYYLIAFLQSVVYNLKELLGALFDVLLCLF